MSCEDTRISNAGGMITPQHQSPIGDGNAVMYHFHFWCLQCYFTCTYDNLIINYNNLIPSTVHSKFINWLTCEKLVIMFDQLAPVVILININDSECKLCGFCSSSASNWEKDLTHDNNTNNNLCF